MSNDLSFHSASNLFSIPDSKVYLDAAALGPLPTLSADAGHLGINRKQQPWELTSASFFEDTRSLRPKLAALIGAETDGISFCPSASYGMAIVARNVQIDPGQTILTLADQFPSNVYPWRRLALQSGAELIQVSPNEEQSVTEALLNSIDDRTALIAIPQVRWTDGSLINAQAVGERARSQGAVTVYDLSQSCGVYKFDVADIKPDFIVCVGYKWLLGPYSLGFFYAAPKWRDGEPLEENWISRRGSDNFTRLTDYTDEYDAGARRFDVGERANFALLPVLEASVDLLQSLGVDNITAYLRSLTTPMVSSLRELGFTCLEDKERAPHYLCARIPESAPANIPERLRQDDIFISQRGDWLRITPHIYNKPEHGDRLIGALTRLLD